MAFKIAFTYGPTNDPIIDVLTGGYAWDMTFSRTISWAIADGLTGEEWGDRAAAIQTFSTALASIEQFIDVEFQYRGSFDDPVAAGRVGADIVYTLDSETVDAFTFAYAYFPGPEPTTRTEQYGTEGGDVFMNFSNDIMASSSFKPGSEGFLTVIHEIGHSLGLKHPFDATPWRPTLDQLDQSLVRDMDWFTIMSYSDQYEQELERWDPATPMILDVLALQYLYGQNPDTNAGDTVLRLQSEPFYYTIWDASGVDRADASGQSEGWTIILPDFQASELVDTLTGFALPLDQLNGTLVDSAPTELIWLMGDIENATGSRFADAIAGNRFDNDLRGGRGDDSLEGLQGNDVIDGNEGLDVAFFWGDQSSFTLTFTPDSVLVQDRRAEGEGIDTLRNIELVEFYTDNDSQVMDLTAFGGAAALSGPELDLIIELYVAYFNRAPDAIGLNYWGTAFANGVTLTAMSEYFFDQNETRATFGGDMTNTDFARVVYDNVLGRQPDQDGLAFWVRALDTNEVSKDQFILDVLAGAKADPGPDATQAFVEQQLADQAYLEAKTDLGALFAVHRGLSNGADAIAVFDGSQASLSEALNAIDQLYAAALDPDTGAFLMPMVGVLDNPFDPIA